MQKTRPLRKIHPPRRQRKPGSEEKMTPAPEFDSPVLAPGAKLTGKVAIITGGDSGIGRSVAVAFARQGADVAICYLPEEEHDAQATRVEVERHGKQCLLLKGHVDRESFCSAAVKRTYSKYGRLDILVNNAGLHYPQSSIGQIDADQLKKTFAVNVFSMFYLVKAAMRYMKEGGCIINTASVTAYRGSGHLLDYSATKGAVVSFTRSLAATLAEKKIRVNAVAPGPVWTPLIVSSMPPGHIATFGSDCPMGRAAQPAEIAPCYVFLASDDSSFMTGQVMHPNGGEIVNG